MEIIDVKMAVGSTSIDEIFLGERLNVEERRAQACTLGKPNVQRSERDELA